MTETNAPSYPTTSEISHLLSFSLSRLSLSISLSLSPSLSLLLLPPYPQFLCTHLILILKNKHKTRVLL